MPANAGFIYATYGTGVTGYNMNSDEISLATSGLNQKFDFTGATFTNAFSVVTDSSGNVYVGDAGANRVLKFSSLGVYSGTSFALTVDNSGGGISPQQIEIDKSGNMYTLNFAGEIRKFSPVSGIPGTATSSILATVPGARGIVVDSGGNGTMYVSTSSATGASIYKITNIETTPSTPAAIFTSAAYPAGQLRGLDRNGTTLYFADSSWTSTGGSIQSISTTGAANQTATTRVAASSTAIESPNSIVFNPRGSGGSDNVMYVADYYLKKVVLLSTSTFSVLNADFITGPATGTFSTGVTGLAFNSGVIPIGDEYIPELTFFTQDNQFVGTPEPGTWALLGSAMLMMFSAKSLRERRQAVRIKK
jgi:hypothetical protein